FEKHRVILAHPSISGNKRWFGTLVSTGESGFFNRHFVEMGSPSKAKALYNFQGMVADAFMDLLPFSKGDILSIIDSTSDRWWMSEVDGVVFGVPGEYLKFIDGM
ncbi:hypothetical protein H0H93_015604, partial [Arthromyces matolae]